jgi:TolB-like protein
MSPEQLKGAEVDSRSDIFSFGILLYEMVTGKRPFQGESGIELASSILKDSPSPVVERRDDLPRHLSRIIQHCLEKDPERRYQSAKDVRNELDGLRAEVDSGQLTSSAGRPLAAGIASEEAQSTPSGLQSSVTGGISAPSGHQPAPTGAGSTPSGLITPITDPQAASRTPWGWIAAAAMLAVVLVLAMLWWRGKDSDDTAGVEPTSEAAESRLEPSVQSGLEPGTRTVAVLPFVNLGADESLDYLRLAVPDEIATSLSRGSGLAIRPFSTTSRLDVASRDPLEIGRELGVANVITGQYFKEGDQLSLTLEAIDVSGNTVIWRDSAVVGSDELLSLRQKVAESVGQGLIPLLEPTAVASTGTQPSSEEAYNLYLRSLQETTDPIPNSEALALLERAVELDPDYAPAWGDLARRRHMFAVYGGGSDADNDLAIEAAQRALELDPELLEPRVRIAIINVERGNLVEAFRVADRLVEERPRVGRTYFLRAYVLRYAGAIDESVRDCETALALDPGNEYFRSCGVTNSLAGRFDWAKHFFDLNPGTDFYYGNLTASLLRQGRVEEALEAGRHASYTILGASLEPYLDGRRMAPETLQQLVSETEQSNDAEQLYWDAGIYAFVGEHEVGLRFLRQAIDSGFCSYPYVDTDPLLAGLRSDPEYADGWAEAVAAGKACNEEFLAQTGV